MKGKKGRLKAGPVLLALACLLLGGCAAPDTAQTPPPPSSPAAAEPTPTAEPTPGPTPAPEPADLEGFTQRLAGVLEQESWDVSYWIFPGSGPLLLHLDAADCGEGFRAAFEDLAWEQVGVEEWLADSPDPEFPYGVSFGTGESRVYLNAGSSYVGSETHSPEGGYSRTYFRAQGAENICDALAALWPGPEIRYAFLVTETQPDPQTQAQVYAKALEERYLASGDVTGLDFRFIGVKRHDWQDGDVWHAYRNLYLSYAVKPAHPQREAWQQYRDQTDADGWVSFEHEISLTDDADGFSRFSFWQGPSDEGVLEPQG